MSPGDVTLVGVITNAILAAVTIVYVVLTWGLAQSSKAAAKSAKEAAASAVEALNLQREVINAQLSPLQPWFKTGGGGQDFHAFQFVLIPLDGAYVLHAVELVDFFFTSLVEGEQGHRVAVSEALTPTDRAFPAYVDETAGVMFHFDAATLADDAFTHHNWRLESWRLLVTFSLSEKSKSTRRVMVYSGMDDPRWRPKPESLPAVGR
jgi:hypothetical protein